MLVVILTLEVIRISQDSSKIAVGIILNIISPSNVSLLLPTKCHHNCQAALTVARINLFTFRAFSYRAHTARLLNCGSTIV